MLFANRRNFALSLTAVCCLSLPAFSQQTPLAPAPQQQPADPWNGNRPQSIRDGVQIQIASRGDVVAMEDALPSKPAVSPKQPRKVLVLCKSTGWVHSSIPLAAVTIKEMGEKTGAYSTAITYDSADITTQNLVQYDVVVLDSTTGSFLDSKDDPATTEARKKALLNFVRGGKGLVGIHAAVDSYHDSPTKGATEPATGNWPEFNHMMNGYFKYHWFYPQKITVKIDDPKSPLNAAFHGQEFAYRDETYTMAQDSFSRKNAHVLLSIDYAKMSDEDKAKEAFKRTDGDYGISWIRREGSGRVFVTVLGHNEHIYFMTPILEHMLAGIQYAAGDLKVDDAPSVK